MLKKPKKKPLNPNFSCGPCTKRPGWTFNALKGAALGRSHRSGFCKAKLQEVIEKSRSILGIPDDYKVGILPASDTGAFEAAMWSLLGERPVDVMAWENFSRQWLIDAQDQLKPDNLRLFETEYGIIPDLSEMNMDHDIVFPWNGTTAGVRVKNGDWIASDRKGLTLCDATSAVFAYDMPWDKLDVTTWSWQKVLGSEAQHGMLVLSPRAVERLETFTPNWPVPKIFRLTKGGKLNEGIFEGSTINTPSMLAVEDCLDALNWVESIGGLPRMVDRAMANAKVLFDWADGRDWLDHLCADPEIRSYTSVCFKLTDPDILALPAAEQDAFVKSITKMLDDEGAAYDINAYRTAPTGLRIWCGSTVETANLEALTHWLDWGYATAKENLTTTKAA